MQPLEWTRESSAIGSVTFLTSTDQGTSGIEYKVARTEANATGLVLPSIRPVLHPYMHCITRVMLFAHVTAKRPSSGAST